MVLRFFSDCSFCVFVLRSTWSFSGKVCKITKFADLAAICIHDGAARALMWVGISHVNSINERYWYQHAWVGAFVHAISGHQNGKIAILECASPYRCWVWQFRSWQGWGSISLILIWYWYWSLNTSFQVLILLNMPRGILVSIKPSIQIRLLFRSAC